MAALARAIAGVTPLARYPALAGDCPLASPHALVSWNAARWLGGVVTLLEEVVAPARVNVGTNTRVTDTVIARRPRNGIACRTVPKRCVCGTLGVRPITSRRPLARQCRIGPTTPAAGLQRDDR